LIERKGSEQAWEDVDKEFFYLGESEKTDAGHNYRTCIRECLKKYGRDDHRDVDQFENCMENCKRRWIKVTSSTSSTTSTTFEEFEEW